MGKIKDWWIKFAYGCECKYWGYGSCSTCQPFDPDILRWKDGR